MKFTETDNVLCTKADSAEGAKEVIKFNNAKRVRGDLGDLTDCSFVLAIIITCIALLSGVNYKTLGLLYCLCALAGIAYLKDSKHLVKSIHSELQFYDDYLILRTLAGSKKEITKVAYKDIIDGYFWADSQYINLQCKSEKFTYERDMNGEWVSQPKKTIGSSVGFYTIFDNEHDYKEIIERNADTVLEVRSHV